MQKIVACLALLSAISFGQDAPPPPRPDSANPELVAALDSLKRLLIASGVVETRWQIGTSKVNASRVHITTAVSDPQNCQLRIHRQVAANENDPRDVASSYFFESYDTVEVLSVQQLADRIHGPHYLSSAYEVVMNHSAASFMFNTEAEATKAAAAVREVAVICRAIPATPNPASGPPSLTDTLRFVDEKLNDSGAVTYRRTLKNPDDSPRGDSQLWSNTISEALTDPQMCILRFRLSTTLNGNPDNTSNPVISLRRIEKLEVISEQDSMNRLRAPNSGLWSMAPTVYELLLMEQGGGTFRIIRFGTEEMANRVAKAMTHAVELCGGGSKDPF